MAETSSLPRGNRYFLTVLGVISLLALAYAILRVDILRARIATLEVNRDRQQEVNAAVTARNEELASSHRALQEQLKTLSALPEQMAQLTASMGDLRGRTDAAERIVLRTELLGVLRQAEYQLILQRDPSAAAEAISAAMARLSGTRDVALNPVREQLQVALVSLRAVPTVPYHDLDAGLRAAADQTAELVALGSLASSAKDGAAVEVPGWRRAWRVVKGAAGELISVRKIDADVNPLVDQEQRQIRQHRLSLSLLIAREAVLRRDAHAYAQALDESLALLRAGFDARDVKVQSLDTLLQRLRAIDIAPKLPDISAARLLLERQSGAVGRAS